jgi:hypothetical protein
MKKDLFIKSIEAIRLQMELDERVSSDLGKAFPNAFNTNLLPDNHFLHNGIIQILQEQMNDHETLNNGMTWVEYFCFQLEFGKKNNEVKVYDTDNTEIRMSTPGELYDFLVSREVK